MRTVDEYLRSKDTVRGWLQDIDARVILAIDQLQRGAGIAGNLLSTVGAQFCSGIVLGTANA